MRVAGLHLGVVQPAMLRQVLTRLTPPEKRAAPGAAGAIIAACPATAKGRRIVRASASQMTSRNGLRCPGCSRCGVRSGDGELVRADSIVGLRCRGGQVEALWHDGWIRLAGPGCPPDFHTQLAKQIAFLNGFLNDQSVVILTADVTTGRSAWTETTPADPAAEQTQGTRQ
jgi:hypothetical protein